ncbi:MAG: hypothetical protein WD226_09825 [Planctomycetota bacterium]
MNFNNRSRVSFLALASMTLGTFALAQSSSPYQYEYDSRQNSGMNQGQQNERMQGQAQSSIRSNQQMQPDWVAIAFDFDDDGTYDIFEYIHSIDLDTARSQSQLRARQPMQGQGFQQQRFEQQRFQRQGFQQQPHTRHQQQPQTQQPNRQQQQQPGWQQQGWQQPGSERMRTQRIGDQPHWMNQQQSSGWNQSMQYDPSMQRDRARQGRIDIDRVASTPGATRRRAEDARSQGRSANKPAVYRAEGSVQSMETVNLIGMNEAHLLATLETNEGRRAQVDLGPRSSVPTERLRQGEEIEVIGTIGKVDDRALLIADRIRVGGETYGVDRQDDQDLTKFEGEIQSIRRVKYRGMDEKYVQAKIELQEGRTAVVDLGPESKHSKVSLNKGDRVSFLADTVRIGGEPALRAEQVSLPNGTTLKLDRTWERKTYRKNGSNSNW